MHAECLCVVVEVVLNNTDSISTYLGASWVKATPFILII